MHDDHPGAEELAQRLEAYASARLSPNRKASARIRAALIEEARMRALEASIGRTGYRYRPGARRLVALLAAATLILGSSIAVFAGTPPGSPLYGARLWLESMTLPADADARALERIRQVDERLVDSERAAAAADEGGVKAATDAYEAALDAAVNDAGTDPDRISRLEATLGHHVAVLESLADKVPESATHGINRAIEASQKAVDKLDQAKPKPGDHGNGNPGGGKPESPGKP